MAKVITTSSSRTADSENVLIKTGDSIAGGKSGTVSLITGNTPFITKSFVDADVSVLNNTITIASHGFKTGAKGQLTTNGTLPGGLSLLTDYFIIATNANTIKLADTLPHAQSGTAVDITSAAGGGTHTFTAISDDTGALILQTGDVGSDDGTAGSIYLITGSAAAGKLGNIQLSAGIIALSPDTAITCNNKPIQSVATPVNSDEAANKGYVDNHNVVNYAISNSCGIFALATTATHTAITNLSVSFTASGINPVMFMLVPDGTTSQAFIDGSSTTSTIDVTIEILRDSTVIGTSRIVMVSAANYEISMPPGGANGVDFPTAGTYTYSAKAYTDANSTFRLRYCKLFVKE